MNENTDESRLVLLAKIDDLFHYRKLPYLLDLVEQDVTKKDALLAKLKNLQVAIYNLDHYLESNWLISHEQLDNCWKFIHDSLEDCGVARPEHEDYLSQIKKYQEHELQLREGKMPGRLRMEYFYFYKSCDVKLLRRIIYNYYPELDSLYPLELWKAFDLITEIDDDIEDVFEDQSTINADRFLIDCVLEGVDFTYSYFRSFLESIEQNHFDGFDLSISSHVQLKEWSIKEKQKTIERLIGVRQSLRIEEHLQLNFGDKITINNNSQT